MFRRVTGFRAWLLGTGGIIGAVAALMSYRDVAKAFLPPEVGAYAPLIMLAGFACALWALGSQPAPVDGVMYRELITLRQDNADLKEAIANLEEVQDGRHIEASQSQLITRALRKGLDALRDKCLAAGWSVQDASAKLSIRVIALGMSRENIVYRNELAETFDAAGFECVRDEWPTGATEHEAYLGAITIVYDDSRNVVRPFVVEALRNASLSVRENEWPISRSGTQLRAASDHPAVIIFVGERA